MQVSPPSPPSSRGPLIVLGIALLLIAGGLVASTLWIVGQFNAPRATPTISNTPTAPTAAITSTASINRLAVIDGDRIYTVDPNGRNLISFDSPGSVPTASLIWSRDGARLMYSYSVGTQSRLISAQPDGRDQRVLAEADRTSVPFYLYGSPDDAHVAFLISDKTNSLDLRVADTDRANSDRSIVHGAPNYASWSPDGQSLLLHVGGTTAQAFVGTYHLGDDRPRPIENEPAQFQTPVWSPTGSAQWLYARARQDNNDLVISDGQKENKLASFDSSITFSWSPDGSHIAYALNSPGSFLFEALTVTDNEGRQSRIYYKGDLMAFFWSPDGSKLAYLTGALVERGPVGRAGGGLAAPSLKQTPPSLQLTWHVIDLKSDQIINLNTFEPTDSFVYLIQYFDQFAQSIAVWSPDSRSLVYTGTPLVGQSGAYVIDTQAANAEPFYVGPGDFAIWSWR